MDNKLYTIVNNKLLLGIGRLYTAAERKEIQAVAQQAYTIK